MMRPHGCGWQLSSMSASIGCCQGCSRIVGIAAWLQGQTVPGVITTPHFAGCFVCKVWALLNLRQTPNLKSWTVVWQVRYPYLDDLLAGTAREMASGDGSHPASSFQHYLEDMAARDLMHGGHLHLLHWFDLYEGGERDRSKWLGVSGTRQYSVLWIDQV
jgi:hypothetical protein